MREEVAQFVVANREPELPAITVQQAMRCVPRDGVKWGKMTVNGERITASWAYRREKYQRRANYVRYHVLLPGQDVQQPTIHYGRLDEIWALQMTPVPDLGLYCANGEVKTIVVALIKPCITHGRDASVEKVYYSRHNRNSTLVDISFIKAVVDRTYPFRDETMGGAASLTIYKRSNVPHLLIEAIRLHLLPFWTLYFTLLVSFIPFWFARQYSSITCKITLDTMYTCYRASHNALIVLPDR